MVLGIDIGKAKFSACALVAGRSNVRDFANTPAGFRKLQQWLQKFEQLEIQACMESTNRYWEALANFLHVRGYGVSVVNPYRTAAYWKSEHLRAKTDRIDAAMIARFCQSQCPPAWTPPSPFERQLRDLVREVECLKAERRRFKTRMEHGPGYALKRILATLDKEVRGLERHITALLGSQPQFAHHYRNLQTVPGIGKVTAYIMLAEIGSKVHHLNAEELVSYAGMAPRIFESGSSIRKSRGTNKIGNSRVKRAFYMPALAATRKPGEWKARKQRLIDRGKPKKVAIGAIMRKLFIVTCGVLKSGRPYNPALSPAHA